MIKGCFYLVVIEGPYLLRYQIVKLQHEWETFWFNVPVFSSLSSKSASQWVVKVLEKQYFNNLYLSNENVSTGN